MRIFIYAFFILLFAFGAAGAQHTKFQKKKYLRKARKAYSLEKTNKALSWYQKLLEADSTNPLYNYETGLTYYFSNFEKAKALPYFQRSLKYSGKDTILENLFFIAEGLHLEGRFGEALSFYKRYLKILEKSGTEVRGNEKSQLGKELDQKMGWCSTGMNFPKDTLKKFTFPGSAETTVRLIPLDLTVNSPYDEYSTLLSPDDSLVYFTTRREENNLKKDFFDEKFTENIYYAWKQNGKYASSAPIKGKINTPKKHEATNYLTSDGKKLYVYKGVRKGTMLISENVNGVWSKPKKINSKNVNTGNWESSLSFCISRENVMYLVSERPGGFGGRDIYQTKQGDDGKWGPLENLGPEINSPYDEDGPYITPDGKWLYFASNGTASIGGFDIFRSENVNGKWSKPVNMGYPFNSTADDIYFHFGNKTPLALLSSSRIHGQLADMNIYALEPYKEELPVVVVNVPKKKDSVILPPLVPPVIQPPDKGASQLPILSKKEIFFGSQSFQPLPDSKIVLETLVDYLTKSGKTAEITGHADATGPPALNMELSLKRAQAIRDYLISKGVSKDQIIVKGKGETEPGYPNNTKEGRAMNRRVEIVIRQ